MGDEFGSRLRSLRLAGGMTQKQVAQPLEKSESAVRMWEHGKNEPDIATLRRLCGLFGCSADTLLCMDGREDGWRKDGARVPLTDLDTPDGAWDENLFPLPRRYANDGFSYYALKITGHEMAPRFLPGDLVLIRRQDACFSGQTAVVRVGAQKLLRRVLFHPDGIVLQPDSLACTAAYYSFAQMEELPVEVQGVAVELFRTL